MDESAHPASHLAVHPNLGIEVLDLGCYAYVEAGRVEASDRANATHTRDEVAPERGVVVADRGYRAEAGYDRSAGKVFFGGHGRIVSVGLDKARARGHTQPHG